METEFRNFCYSYLTTLVIIVWRKLYPKALFLCFLQEFPGLDMTSLNNVLAQGMNRKKKHEVGKCSFQSLSPVSFFFFYFSCIQFSTYQLRSSLGISNGYVFWGSVPSLTLF